MCKMEHTSLSRSQPLPHPPPQDHTVLLITDTGSRILACAPLAQDTALAALKEQLNFNNKDHHRNTQKTETIAMLVEGMPW